MDTLEAILTRRSVRSFTDRMVPDDVLKKILEAAMFAPSAGNQQPWQYVVVTDRKLLEKLAVVSPNSAPAAKAPLAMLVCADMSLEKHPGYWVIDCSAAIQNMLLAAHALGLGGVWCGIYPAEDRMDGCRRLFKLPKEVVPHSLIPLGYPAAPLPPPPQRYDASRVHRNGY